MLIIFTGNGKGKTTAALGQALRTVGRGKNVLMIQFIKGPWKSGEDYIQIVSNNTNEKPAGKFKLVKMGLGFVGILGDKLPKEDHAQAAKMALEYFISEMRQATPASADLPAGTAGATAGKWDMIILDEVNVAVSLGLLTTQVVLEAVKDLPPEKFVIFTGRGAPQEFIDRADLVTEMREIKHPYNDGKLAKIALEF